MNANSKEMMTEETECTADGMILCGEDSPEYIEYLKKTQRNDRRIMRILSVAWEFINALFD